MNVNRQNRFTLLRRSFFPILFIFLCARCASQSINVIEPVSMKLNHYSTLLVDVSADNIEYFSEARDQLQNLLISKLRKKEFFEKVISESSPESEAADLQLSVTIVDLFKVTRSNRLFWGYIIGGCFGAPGSAKIQVIVKLIDHNTKKLLGESDVSGISSRHSTFAGTTKQAIKLAADQIVEYLSSSL